MMENKAGEPLVSQTLRVACALQYRNMPLRSTARPRMPSPIQEGSSTEGEESGTRRDSDGARSSATYEEKVRRLVSRFSKHLFNDYNIEGVYR